MRTCTFQSVFEGTLRRLGIDPLGEALRYDTARGICEHINNAVEYAWSLAEWPELMVTEERAYRETWRNTAQYRRSSSRGVPDEVFYLTDSTYYQVLKTAPADPPPGTLPTNTTYFIPLNPVDMFIPFDQPGRQSIGQVFGVYNLNPRLSISTGYRFRLSERGLDVQPGGRPTVFVHYQIRPSRFTMIPYADGKPYRFRDVIYDAETGECYVAVTDSTGLPPSAPVYWRKVRFPEFLRPYAVAQAAATALREWDPKWQASSGYGTGEMLQNRLAYSDRLEAEAQRYLERQYTRLVEQGSQHAYYTLARRAYPYNRGWICSPEFCALGAGGTAVLSTLSSEFVNEWGAPEEDLPNDMQTEGLKLPLVNGQDFLDFNFVTPKVDSDGNPTSEWELENALIENTIDADPLLLFFNIINRTAAGGRIMLSAAPDTGNYIFRARVRVPLLV